MEMKIQMKNRTHKYKINRPRYRHGCKYSKYKTSFTIMILKCTREHLINI